MLTPEGAGLQEGPPGLAWCEGAPSLGNSSRQCLEASAPHRGCEEGWFSWREPIRVLGCRGASPIFLVAIPGWARG